MFLCIKSVTNISQLSLTTIQSDTFGQFVINILDFDNHGQQLNTLDQGSTDHQFRRLTGLISSEILKNLLVLVFLNFSGPGPVLDFYFYSLDPLRTQPLGPAPTGFSPRIPALDNTG